MQPHTYNPRRDLWLPESLGEGLIPHSQKERDRIALGISPLEYYRRSIGYVVCGRIKDLELLGQPHNPTNFYLTEIRKIRPDGSTAHWLGPTEISHEEDPSKTDIETLERLFLFLRMGGTEQEFWELRRCASIFKNGENATGLPTDVSVVPVYRRGYTHNPERKGLKEVYLEGDGVARLDVEPSHSSFYHLFHPPRTFTGLGLWRASLGMFAGIDTSLVKRVLDMYR